MKFERGIRLAAVVVWCAAASTATAAEPAAEGQSTDSPLFERDILPILAQHCQACHGRETRESELDLRTVGEMLRGGANGPAIVREHPETSLLLELVKRGEMPPDGEKLSDIDVALISRWIASGAPALEEATEVVPAAAIPAEDRRHWSFQTPARIDLPTVSQPDLTLAPIDSFLLARLEQVGLTYSPEAERATYIRRAYFDLIGLPPTPEALIKFVADPRPDAYERLIDELLASPHYGERWGRHWLDAAGYVDNRLYDGDAATVYVNEGIWRYRDYVVRSFNADKPFDRFIVEQLAGDELVDWRNVPEYDDGIRDLLIATGYLRSVEDHTSEPQYGIDKRYEVLFAIVDTVSTSLLGLTMDCCRCHNHKYDPLPQRDYYRLLAAFEPALNPRDWKRPQERYLHDVSAAEQAAIEQHNAEVDRQVQEVEGAIQQIYEPHRQRLRDERLAALPDDKREETRLALATPAGERSDPQRKVVELFEREAPVSQEQIEALFDEEERAQVAGRRQRQAELNAQRQSSGVIQALWDVGPPPATRLLRRGNAFAPGAIVTAGHPAVLSPDGYEAPLATPADAQGATSGARMALARWITGPTNPLTARVIVNRVWHHHFGRGLVLTLGNFGRAGAPPSHPELLDWLALDFQEHGWSIKRLHRQIMLSTAYRQVSRFNPAESVVAVQADRENMLLWRMNLRRLESEVVRDSVLAAGGRLDLAVGGPPVKYVTPSDGLSISDSTRRSLYLLARRVYPLSFLEVFDSPIVPVNCVQRTTSATVLQTFTFLNGGFILGEARQIASRVLCVTEDSAGNSDAVHLNAARIDRAYGLILSRPPTESETARALSFLAEQRANYAVAGRSEEEASAATFGELCHMLLCTSEFLYVE